VENYIQQKIVPDSTFRNWNSYSDKVGFGKGVNVTEAFSLLPDPQTNGGLLISVSKAGYDAVSDLLNSNNLYAIPIGRMAARAEKIIFVQ
jgi:selenide,water dikinase